jgi:transposase-like protein
MLSVKRYTKRTRTYDNATLRNAVLAVKERKLTISQASRDFSVPRKTIGK